jgi:bifunctional enzyme CysN/CysC
MDLVEYSEERFNQIKADYLAFAKDLNLPDIQFAPISALNGDNVVNPSENMPWHNGAPLMTLLEQIEIAQDHNFDELRFPVQYVNRPNLNFRGYCGTLTSGVVQVGDMIKVLPSGKQSRVKSIVTWDGELDRAFAPMAVTLTLEDEIDISRGDLLVHAEAAPEPRQHFSAHLVWMDENALNPARDYEIKLATSRQTGRISRVHHRIDVNTLEHIPTGSLELNEIAKVDLSLERAVVADNYRLHKGTGAFILVDRFTNRTVAAGMILPPEQTQNALKLTSESLLNSTLWEQRFGQKASCIQVKGGTAEQRAQLLYSLEKALFDQGKVAFVLDTESPQVPSDTDDTLVNWLTSKGIILLTNAASELSSSQIINLDNDKDSTSQRVTAWLKRL